jgi:hypothetical protein
MDVLCGEIGCAEGERWSEPVRLATEDLDALQALRTDGIVELREGTSGVDIAGMDHVGVVTLPTGRRLHIRPKVPDVVLLDWIAYVGDCPPILPQTSGRGFALRGRFPELLAARYLAELEALTRRTLRADFVEQRHDASTVRGRILPGALARAFHRFPSIPQSRRTRSLDTPHHRLLAAALDRASTFIAASEPRPAALLAQLRREFADVPREMPPVADCVAVCPPGYAAAVRLASLLLLGASPSPGATAAGTRLLIPLAGVWERALRKMCAEVAGETAWRPVPDAARTKRWDDGPGFRDPLRWMTADVILAAAGRRWVLDAKYKRDYGDEDRNDRFQMTAYAMAFEARRATLVYPTGELPRARWRLLLSGQIGGHATTIDSFELPMSAGPAVCATALRDAMLALGAGAVKDSAGQGILSPP